MIMIVTAQILREIADDPNVYTRLIDEQIKEIERDFMKPEFKAVMETVGLDGEFIDHFNGRMLCPGHAIEASWFILQEARYRGNDQHLVTVGTTILDWMWERGWDEKHGGIIYYRDIKGLPVQEYWHDMKLWWPQNEAIIATLVAYQATSDGKYAKWHKMIHDWAYQYFPDTEYGEWFGYLHRDGRVSSPIKGNLWKGPFHIPRMQLQAWQTLEQTKLAKSYPSKQ
jgi:N-acylglucosamine 2-epimerase